MTVSVLRRASLKVASGEANTLQSATEHLSVQSAAHLDGRSRDSELVICKVLACVADASGLELESGRSVENVLGRLLSIATPKQPETL